MGSPYDFGVCELVEVLMHAPHSRVWCQTLGLCDSRFYTCCLTHQQKKSKMLSVVYEKVCHMRAHMLVVGGVCHEIQEGKVCRWHQAIVLHIHQL